MGYVIGRWNLLEKYSTGNYICISKLKSDIHWDYLLAPSFDDSEMEYVLIHKKDKDILDAYLKDNSIKIEWYDFSGNWQINPWEINEETFIDFYTESCLFQLLKK